MTQTTRLRVTYVDASQTLKTVTINQGSAAITDILAKTYSVDCTVGGTITPTYADAEGGDKSPLWFMCLEMTGTPGAGFNFVLPDKEHFFIARNLTGQTATIKTAAGTGATLAAAARAVFYCDGTDVEKFAS